MAMFLSEAITKHKDTKAFNIWYCWLLFMEE